MANLEDPLEEYSGLSIFSRTFSSLSIPPPPYNLNHLLSAHSALKSMPVQNPEKLMKEAKSILDTSSQPPIAEVMNEKAAAKDKNEAVAEKLVESPRVRRQGLGRKRPRFSLLPNSSQSTVNLEPTLDIDKLKDPEEFFKAFERLENAKIEIAKQTGHVSIGSNQYSTSMAPRPRRPGIPGRSRSVKYQHLYPTMSSQETFEEDVLSPSNYGSQQEAAYPDVESQEIELENVVSQQREAENGASEESELAGSILKAEKRIGNLLDELLAHDYDDLDGDGAITLLQDHLEIKSLDIEKLNLPEWQVAPRIDLKASGESLPKPRNVLSDIHNLLKGTRGNTPMKQKTAENSVPSFGSPTPPKSPLASLSLLKKRILQPNPSSNPFSFDDVDESLARNASPTENMKRMSDQVDVEKDMSISGKLKSLVIEEHDTAVNSLNSPKVAIGDFTSPSDEPINDNLTSLGSSSEVGALEPGGMLEHIDSGMDKDENPKWPGADANVQTNGPNEMENVVENVIQEPVASLQLDENVDDFIVAKSTDIQSGIQNQFEQSSHEVVEGHAMHGCFETHDGAPEQTQDPAIQLPNKRTKESSAVSMNKRTQVKPRPRKELAPSRRQSLAAAGTSWETGVRRSTRIRSRPLAYWKGERFLYGRIHQSLATVIGIKYESPGKVDGKPTMKVKSFVSDEYKDLLDLAALN